MRNRPGVVLFTAALAGAALASAQAFGPQSINTRVDFPQDSPVGILSINPEGSRVTPRGSAYLMEVHASLSLRNSSQKRIRGVTLAVLAQDVTPGGKASVSVPSLDVAPGEAFSVRIDQTLLRPLGTGGPAVDVKLDGVLFDDLSFYGPDKLHSQRDMTVWELEARRDRKYFKNLLDGSGREALASAMQASLARQANLPKLPGVQMVRGRSTAADPDRQVQFAFLHIPDSPVEPSGGMAYLAANEASEPRFDVKNLSKRAVRYLEIGWIVEDRQGHEFLAASLPADLNLRPGQSSQVVQDSSIRFPDRVSLQGMKGFVSSVEFLDGSYWIPSRKALEDDQLRQVVGPSPEEQRLAQIYLRKGLPALIEELKKF